MSDNYIIGLAVLIVSLFLTGCEEERGDTVQVTARPVLSAVVGESEDVIQRSFPGTVRASQRVDLSFTVSGQLVELPILAGQEVAEDEVLARLDERDYRSSRDAAKSVYDQARADLDRNLTLFEKGFVAQSRLDIFRARQGVALADLERAQKALDDTYLRAPFAGVIALRYMENFQDIQAREPVLSLQDISVLEIAVNLPEVLVARYRGKGREFEVTASIEAAMDSKFDLTVSEIATQADPDTGTYETVLAFQAPEHISVLPGMMGTVTAIGRAGDEETEGQIFVPTTAVFAEGAAANQSLVWVIDSETLRVTRRPVALGNLQGESVRVLTGLDPGERIVTAGVHYLSEGQEVRLMAGIDGQ